MLKDVFCVVCRSSGVARGGGAARPGGGILDKLYVIISLNYSILNNYYLAISLIC